MCCFSVVFMRVWYLAMRVARTFLKLSFRCFRAKEEFSFALSAYFSVFKVLTPPIFPLLPI